jgi:hypothetical protein
VATTTWAIDREAVSAAHCRGAVSNIYPTPFLANASQIEFGADER